MTAKILGETLESSWSKLLLKLRKMKPEQIKLEAENHPDMVKNISLGL